MRHIKISFINLLLLCAFVPKNSLAQKDASLGIGPNIAVNIHDEALGLGFKLLLYPRGRATINPEITYYAPFLTSAFGGIAPSYKIHQLYTGLSINVTLSHYSICHSYLIANGGHMFWFNSNNSTFPEAEESNMTGEFGLGFTGNKCKRLFFEMRYNPLLEVASVRFGYSIIFDCHYSERYGSGKKQYKKHKHSRRR